VGDATGGPTAAEQTEWPLIGREALLRRLASTFDRHRGVLIVGDAGVGKSRLARELARLASERGRQVESIVASSAALAMPYGALTHLISAPIDSADQVALTNRLLTELRGRGGSREPLVLVVDDVNYLDEASAVLLHQAALHRIVSPILTARTGEAMPPVLVQLWKDRIAERLEIPPLSRAATVELAEKALAGPVDSFTLSELWRTSGGNPLFLREIVLGGLESGVLRQEDSVWRAQQTLAPSERLSEIVGHRFGLLSEPQRTVVELLAVADAMDSEALRQFAEDKVIEDLEERLVVRVEASGNRKLVRLAHPIYAEAVASALPRTRVRRIMLKLADSLERTRLRRPDDVLRLALWRLEGGGTAPSQTLLAAANRAMALFDAPLAERLARAALSDPDAEVPARLMLGRALASQQRVLEADQALIEAERSVRTDDEIAQVALARANLLFFRARRPDEAARLLVDAMRRVHDVDWRDEMDSLLTLFRSAAGQLQDVAAAGRRLVQRTDARPRAVAHTLLYSSIANVMLGRFAEAEQQVAIGLQLAPQVQEQLPLTGQMLLINRVMANAYAGRSTKALALGLEGHQRAMESRAPELVTMWAMNVAECHMVAGDIRSALPMILSALVIARERDPFAVHGIDAGLASVCAAWLGRRQQAEELLHEIIDGNLAGDVRSTFWLDRASVWVTWLGGHTDEAAQHAIEAGERALANTHTVWAAIAFHDAARLGLGEQAAERMQPLADEVEGELVPTMAFHARSLALGDAVGLERAASAFERMGSSLYAAEAAAQAHHVYLARGLPRVARVAAARASLLAAKCPGVRTPALADAVPVPLTPRELQTARLAAEGTSSRELAQRLGISVRTVDNHLGRIYSKLGISGRQELPEVLGLAALHKEGPDSRRPE
jgi:DNA-binding CsgD family transcriptional regulator/energy-coupling factor transporter ATP-binding protein EcfA2